jgi:uncharacterized protein YlxW (UPF0749 family)
MTDVGGYAIDRSESHWAGGRRPSMRPPPKIQSRLVVGAVALVVGFLVAVQAVGTDDPTTSRLATERPDDLTRILADLNDEADRLSRQVSALRVKILRYRGSARGEELALRDAQEALAGLRVLSGTVPVEGPGLRITVQDAEGRVGWEALLDLIQELRDAGAEAIAVNGVRVVAATWFGPAEGGAVVDGERVSAPYEVQAIGPADGLEEALGIPGGPLSVIAAQPGAAVEVGSSERLSLPAASGDVSFRYARPVG